MKYFMKSLFVFIALSVVMFAQNAIKVKMEEFSINRKYSIVVEGYFYEGFTGPLSVILYRIPAKKLWEREINDYRNFIMPKVSNNGISALLCDGYIQFIDSTSRFLGSFGPDSGWMMYFDSEENERINSSFSEDGSTYYDVIIEQSGNRRSNTKLLAINNSGNAKWNLALGKFEFGRIRVIKNRIILDDFGMASVEYINRVTLCDINGTLIKQMDYDLKSGYEKLLIDPINFEVIVEYANTYKAYSLIDGNYTRDVEKNEFMKLDKDIYYGSQHYAE